MVIVFTKTVIVGVCLGACVLMLPGCRTSGPPIARQQRIRPQEQEEIADRRAPVNQSNVPRDEGVPLPVAGEEEKSPHVADTELGSRRPSEGIDGATVRAGAHRTAARGGDDPPAVRGADATDDGRNDSNPDELASKVPDEGEADTVKRETSNGGVVGQEDPASSAPLVPVIPARVEKTASAASREIVYPEAPAPITVSRQQVDALRLPSTDPKQPIIGIWEQVRGDNSADFAEGNYTRTVLVFRTDGVLEVVRWFGSQNEIRLDSKLNYTATGRDRIRLELPRGSSGASRHAYSVPVSDGTSVRVDPVRAEFPAPLTCKRNNSELVIDGKTYRHVEPR